MLELIVIPSPFTVEPFLVVISITPLPALDPYKAAAFGPLRTEIDSTSFGLISEIPPPVTSLL